MKINNSHGSLIALSLKSASNTVSAT